MLKAEAGQRSPIKRKQRVPALQGSRSRPSVQAEKYEAVSKETWKARHSTAASSPGTRSSRDAQPCAAARSALPCAQHRMCRSRARARPAGLCSSCLCLSCFCVGLLSRAGLLGRRGLHGLSGHGLRRKPDEKTCAAPFSTAHSLCQAVGSRCACQPADISSSERWRLAPAFVMMKRCSAVQVDS